MSFMTKKKRYKFQVKLNLVELSSVTFVSGNLFSKVRLQDGGSFTDTTTREEVYHHCVKWDATFSFVCKMNANASTGLLETCLCRVSVRKEVKGGKTFQKLGFADVNLAEYAGAGAVTRKYLLEGYDTKHRQDNSTLKIILTMTLLSGDPLFKAPAVQKLGLPGESLADDLTLDNKGLGDSHEEISANKEEDSGNSEAASSGFGSLTRYKKTSPETASCESSQPGHSRNGSYTSAGYASMPSHSRQSSTTAMELGHHRNPSTGSCRSDTNKRRRVEMDRTNKERIDATRVDADDLVNELVEGLHIEDCDTAEGLQLYIAKDGTTALGSEQIKNSLTPGSFKHVVFDNHG